MANLQDILKQLTEERNNLDKAIEALSNLDGTGAAHQQPRRRKMSASARARISAAQRARWAKSKGSQKAIPEGKRHISAAGRARIVAAAKARWAKVRAGKK